MNKKGSYANIPYCKDAIETIELCHLDSVKRDFGVGDTGYIAISKPAADSRN